MYTTIIKCLTIITKIEQGKKETTTNY
jgi:hypothetical protein